MDRLAYLVGVTLWPSGQDQWDAFAAERAAAMARFQLHVEPDWLFALCRVCGFELEQSPPADVPAFRYEVAVHTCPTSPPATPAPEFEEVLF